MNEIAQKSKSTNRYLLFITLLLIINTLLLSYHLFDFNFFKYSMYYDCDVLFD